MYLVLLDACNINSLQLQAELRRISTKRINSRDTNFFAAPHAQ